MEQWINENKDCKTFILKNTTKFYIHGMHSLWLVEPCLAVVWDEAHSRHVVCPSDGW